MSSASADIAYKEYVRMQEVLNSFVGSSFDKFKAIYLC